MLKSVVTLTIALPERSTTHRRPPLLAMPRASMPVISLSVAGGLAGGILITFLPAAVQRLPSGPVVILFALVSAAMSNFRAPLGLAGENFATPPFWVTHRLPSGPVVMPVAPEMSAGLNSVTAPAGVIFAMLPSATQMFPSGPWVRCRGMLVTGNSPSTLGGRRAPTPGWPGRRRRRRSV